MPIKFSTYRAQVRLAPGQQLHFQQGRGYYAGPAAPTHRAAPELVSENGQWRPTNTATPPPSSFVPHIPPPPRTPPVDPYAASTPAAIDARATAQAQAGLTPQQNEVRRQQALAQTQAASDEAAITGFQTAASGLIQGIAPTVGAGYDQAAKEIGALGAGVGQLAKDNVQGEQTAEDAFSASQGQSGGHTIDPGAQGAVMSTLGGVLPGDNLSEQGASEQALVAQQSILPLDAGREQMDARMAQARSDRDGYAQQLLQIAAQFPALKEQALTQLNQYELDKAKYREGLVTDRATIASQRRQDALQLRAEIANEKAAGLTAGFKKQEYAYKWASLQFQSQKAAAAAQAAAAKGKTIDVQASKLLGHLVYKDGTEDTSIKVKQSATTSPQQKAQVNRAKATSTARINAYKYAVTLLGKPNVLDSKTATAARASGAKVGKYIADPSQKYNVPGGVFPPPYPGAPATTNNPARAQRTGGGASNYDDAQTKVWGEIDGDGLMARYGYSRAQVMQMVNQALARAGWRK